MLSLYKFSSSFGAILMLLISLILTAMTVYGWINEQLFWSNQLTKQWVLGIMGTVSFLLILVSVIGIVGIVRKVCCFICIYQIFVVLFLLVFVLLGIQAIVLPDQLFNGCKESTNDQVKQAYQIYQESNMKFCKTGCRCSLSQNSFAKYSQTDQKYLTQNYLISPSGLNSTQSCPSSSNWSLPQLNLASALSQIQPLLSCSSWCPTITPNIIYRFSNINNGKPTQFCYTAIIVEIIAFCIASVFFIVMLCNLCVCCHKSNRNKKLHQRLVFITQQDYNRGYYRQK